ncbi:MAG: histone H1 [Rhodothermales bacterium]|nr:histone H1 [Rhodothermales bacterium]
MSKFNELKSFVNDLEDDFSKFFDKGNKAAGTRVRKAMQDLKAMAQDVRVQVQEMKNK